MSLAGSTPLLDGGLLEAIHLGFCVVEARFGPDGEAQDCLFLESNRAFEEQTGLADPVGRTARQLLPHLDDGWIALVGRVALTGAAERVEGYLTPLEKWFEVYAARVNAPERRWVAVLLRNVTERKQLEREREAARAQAEALAEELQRRADLEEKLIGIVSHDLRTPLNSILLGVTSLLRNGSLAGMEGRTVARIRAAAERARRLTCDLLDFAQSRAVNGIALHPEQVDVNALVQEVVQELLALHPHRDVVLQLGEQVCGRADGDRLRQVMENLLSNALKYSPAESPVGVSTRQDARGITLRVHNHGPPITRAQAERLFEAFRRGEDAGASDEHSVGLGLYIVRHLVEAHGGTVTFDTSAATGTTFTVWLPPLTT